MTTDWGTIVAFIWEPRDGGKLYLDPREVTIVRAAEPERKPEITEEEIGILAKKGLRYEIRDGIVYKICPLSGHSHHIPAMTGTCLDPHTWTWEQRFRSEISRDVIADLADATGAEIVLDDVLFNRMDRAIAHSRRDIMRAFLEGREAERPGRYTTEGMYYVVLGNERTRMSVKEYMDDAGKKRQG